MKVLFFDIESTGFPRNFQQTPWKAQPSVWEFYGELYAITGDSFPLEPLESLHFRCKPRAPIPAKLCTLLNVTNEGLEDLPPIGHFWSSLRDFFSKADGWCSHNLKGFDSKMMIIEAVLRREHTSFPWPKVGLCTLVAGKSLYPKGPNSLKDLHYRCCDSGRIQDHGAKGDTQMLVEVARELHKDGDLPLTGNVNVF